MPVSGVDTLFQLRRGVSIRFCRGVLTFKEMSVMLKVGRFSGVPMTG